MKKKREHKKLTLKYVFETCFEREYRSKFCSFFECLGIYLDQYAIYRFYWWFIWSNLRLVFYVKPRELKRSVKHSYQRLKYGIADDDAWRLNTYLISVLAAGAKKFIRSEYGKPPVDWDKHICQTHDKKLFEDLVDFIHLYNSYKNNLEAQSKLKDFETENNYEEYKKLSQEEYELEQELYKSAKYIISRYLEVLWT